MRQSRLWGALALTAGSLALGMGGVVHATGGTTDTTPTSSTEPAPPPAPAATSQITLPLLGASLVVDITTNAGGGLVDVALNPADTYTATHVKPNRVAFVNEDGSVKVRVSAKRGGERVSVRAGSLGDISGDGGWSGDVFGTGVVSSVAFTIGAGSDGNPDITGIAVTSPLENTVGEVNRGMKEHDEHSIAWAAAEITFTDAGQTRTLRIKAAVSTGGDDDDDDGTRATVKVSLSRVHGGRIAEGEAAGPHTWSHMLCDGTTATVNYTVNADGSVSDVVANPAGDVGSRDGRTVVKFSRGESMTIKVKHDGEALVVTTSERIRCDRTDPSVNTPVDTAPDDDDDDDHHGDHHGDRDGDHHGDHDGDHSEHPGGGHEDEGADDDHGHHHGDDGSASTTTAPSTSVPTS